MILIFLSLFFASVGMSSRRLYRLRYLGYDRACGLVPFLKNQAQNGIDVVVQEQRCYWIASSFW